jgi:hypothetical protein
MTHAQVVDWRGRDSAPHINVHRWEEAMLYNLLVAPVIVAGVGAIFSEEISIGLKIGALVLCIEIAALGFFFARIAGIMITRP